MAELMARLAAPDNLPIVALLTLFPLAVAIMLLLGRREDRRRGAGRPRPSAGLPDRVHTWPHLLQRELAAALLVTAVLILWSVLADAPLEAPADPTETPNPAKAPWYFVGLQELLVYFDPWIAGVALPLLILLGLAAIPYVDPNPAGNGRYTLRDRPLAVGLFLAGLTLWSGLIVVGSLCRGPGWAWFWPWEPWDTTRAALTTPLRTLPELVGAAPGWPAFLAGLAVAAGWILLWAGLVAGLLRRLDPVKRNRPGIGTFWMTALLVAGLAGVAAKIVLRLLLDVSYVLTVPWLPRLNL